MSNNSIYFNTLKKYENEIALNEFGRGKDKQKRKSKGIGTAGKVGLGAAGVGTVGGVYGGNVVKRAATQRGVEKMAVEEGSRKAAQARQQANNLQNAAKTNKKMNSAAKKFGQTASNLEKVAAKNADNFIEKGGIAKRSLGIAKQDAKQVAGKVAGKVSGAKSFLVGAAKKLLRK